MGWGQFLGLKILQRYKSLSLCTASAWKGVKKEQREVAQRKLKSRASLYTRGRVRRECSAKKRTSPIQCKRSGLSRYSWPAFNFKIAEEYFYPLSALTAKPVLSFWSQQWFNHQRTHMERVRAGKLPWDGCFPPPSPCRLSTEEETAGPGGERGYFVVWYDSACISYVWLASFAFQVRQSLCFIFSDDCYYLIARTCLINCDWEPFISKSYVTVMNNYNNGELKLTNQNGWSN